MGNAASKRKNKPRRARIDLGERCPPAGGEGNDNELTVVYNLNYKGPEVSQSRRHASGEEFGAAAGNPTANSDDKNIDKTGSADETPGHLITDAENIKPGQTGELNCDQNVGISNSLGNITKVSDDSKDVCSSSGQDYTNMEIMLASEYSKVNYLTSNMSDDECFGKRHRTSSSESDDFLPSLMDDDCGCVPSLGIER